MSHAALLALLGSPAWDDYMTASQVVAIAWVAAWLLARHTVRRSKVRFVTATLARGLGGALIASDLFNLIVEIGAGHTRDAVISLVGACFVGLALMLVEGDDWFSGQFSKAKRALRRMLARRRVRAAVGGAVA